MKKIRLGLIVLGISFLAGCSSYRNTAPVYDRTTGLRPVEVPRVPVQTDNRGFYTVKKGDTLGRIAADHGQNYRDLIVWNNLTNPNDIKVDQILRVLPPDGSTPLAHTGNPANTAQTAPVSSGAGVEVRPLVSVPPPSDKPAPVITHKTGPRGDKRPYSEAILADLQKPDALTPPGGSSPKQLPQTGDIRGGDIKGSEKPVPTPIQPETSSDDEGVAWIWPAEGKIIATFDEGKSKGIDIAGKAGQQVVAAGSGKVMYAGSGIRGYGNLVIVKHTNSLLSAYAHNHAILVKEGQNVIKGQKIAEMGKSDADSVKLHFEIRRQGKPVDPSKFLPNR